MDVDDTLLWLHAVAAAIDENTDYLTQLDAAIGDADHGANMRRGWTAVVAALVGLKPATVGAVLTKAGATLVSSVGGASGTLYGSALRAMGKSLTQRTIDGQQLLAALTDGLVEIQRLGAAVAGDKTMVDAYAPAIAAFENDLQLGGTLGSAATCAADAAEEGMRATTSMLARKGRASYLGARSIGHPDPGATSTALVFRALADVLAGS